MLDKNKPYSEVGYNVYGIKWLQNGVYYRLDGKEVDKMGRLIPDPVMTEDDFESYWPDIPDYTNDNVDPVVKELRDKLDKLDIAYSPLAKEKALRKKLEAANDIP